MLRKIGKRTVKCSRHGTLRVSGVTRPDFLSRFYCGSKVRLRGTSDHAKTKQAVIPLMSKGMRVKALSVSPLEQPAKKVKKKKQCFLLLQRKYETYPRQPRLICSLMAFIRLSCYVTWHHILLCLRSWWRIKPKTKRFYN